MNKVIKNLAFVSMLLVFATYNVYASKITAESKITAVTVYPDRALVTRSVQLEVTPQAYDIVFDHLPGAILEESVRASGKGTAAAKLLGLEIKRSFLEKTAREEVRELEKELQNLKDKDTALTNEQEALKAQSEFLKSIKVYSADQLSKEIVTREPTTEEWGKILTFLGDGLKEALNGQQKIEIERRALKEKIRVKQKQLNKLRGIRRLEEKSVTVSLEVSRTGTLDLDLFYVIPGASWKPLYDARAFEATKTVELSYYGQVQQNTGEDWEGINLTLSTAKPAIGARMPKIRPYYLRKAEEEAARVGVGGAADRLTVGKREKLFQMVSVRERELAAAPSTRVVKSVEIVTAPAEEVGTSVNFKVKKREAIPSDNQPHKATIAIESFPAEFDYVTTPKLSPYAYLKAAITNKTDYPLLAGRANVFLGENFVGTSRLDTVASKEKFDLHLGIDQGDKGEKRRAKGEDQDYLPGE